MTGVAPGVRTHSVRPVPIDIDGSWEWECRHCEERHGPRDPRRLIEQEPCGTRAPDPGAAS